MARLAARSAPSTTIDEKARSAEPEFFPFPRADLTVWLLIIEQAK
jgi:hypothetical protein